MNFCRKYLLTMFSLIVLFALLLFTVGCSKTDKFLGKWYGIEDRTTKEGNPIIHIVEIKKDKDNYVAVESAFYYENKPKWINIKEIGEATQKVGIMNAHLVKIPYIYDVEIQRHFVELDTIKLLKLEDSDRLYCKDNKTRNIKFTDNDKVITIFNKDCMKLTDEVLKQLYAEDEQLMKVNADKWVKNRGLKIKRNVKLNNITVRNIPKEEEPYDTHKDVYSYFEDDKEKPSKDKLVVVNDMLITRELPSATSNESSHYSKDRILDVLDIIDASNKRLGMMKRETSFKHDKRMVTLRKGFPITILSEYVSKGVKRYKCEYQIEGKTYSASFFNDQIEEINGIWYKVRGIDNRVGYVVKTDINIKD